MNTYYGQMASSEWAAIHAASSINLTTERNTMDLIAEEYAQFEHSPDWELRNIVKALNMLSFLNGPRENARLTAVQQILRDRKRK